MYYAFLAFLFRLYQDAGKEHIGHVFNKLLKELGSPVDFQLPECLKKERPTSYTYIRRSIHIQDIYVTKRIKKRLQDDGIFCSCNTSSACGRDCQCGMLLSSCSSSCKCGDSCLNKPFQQRPVKKMKLVKVYNMWMFVIRFIAYTFFYFDVPNIDGLNKHFYSPQTEKCGSGLLADEDIKRREFVIEYVGEVIDDKTCEERLWKMKHSGETNFYLCEINRDMVIDATHKGNKSRYINHSCQPNTEMQKWIIDGETRIGIFATRDIKRGEQLSYDYQFVQFGADQDCHCGALGCRQKLGAKPSKHKSSSSDAAFKLVAREVAASSHKLKQVLSDRHAYDCANGHMHTGTSQRALYGKKSQRCNCVGEVIRMAHPANNRCFALIKHFDKKSRKHTIMYEDGSCEIIDMSEVDWEICKLGT
ncbi:hypothetical protein GIB67_038592 [Kingdonia uniflora]|uniref:Histone-lysine N-methyltransferase ASHH3 n=1 Tax=Kingdonia uniflora TaxID=39325 RepID=A0A7J7NPI0_9MAGN|nr:hypothetical protein GIB67_038592 [Kingdonia uniflora]